MASAESSEPSVECRSKQQTAKACKRRRNQNTEIEELGELLPFCPEIGKSLDKLSVLRLTTSYIRFHNFMKSAYGNERVSSKRVFTDTFANSVDGFLLVLDGQGTVLFAADGMIHQVGLDPKDVIGHSINDIIESEEDAERIRDNLKPQGMEQSQPRSFCIRLKSEVGSGRRATSRFNTHMMVQFSGHLKVSLLPPPSSPSSSPSSPPSSSSSSSNGGRELEALPRQPEALGLIVECRLIETSPSILELSVPRVCISVTVAPPHGRILAVDEKFAEALGFDPFHVVGSILHDYVHPSDYLTMYPYKFFFILRGYVTTPMFRFLSSTGDWVSVQMEVRRRYNVGSKPLMVAEMKLWLLRSSDSSPYLRPSSLPHTLLSLPLSSLEKLFNLAPFSSHPFSLPPLSSREAVKVGERVHLKQSEVAELMELEESLHLFQKCAAISKGLSSSSVGSGFTPFQSALPLPSPPPSLPSQPPSVSSFHSSSTSDSDPSTSPHSIPSGLSSTPSSSDSIANSPHSILHNILHPISSIHSHCGSIEGPGSSIHSYPDSIEGPTSSSMRPGLVDACTEYTETVRPTDAVNTTTGEQPPFHGVCSPEFHSVPVEPAFHSTTPIPASPYSYPPSSTTIPPSFQFGTQQLQNHQQHHQQQQLLLGAGATETEDDLELLFREFADQQEPSQQQQWLLQQQQLHQQIQQQQQILQQLLKLQQEHQSLWQQPGCPATRTLVQELNGHLPFPTFTYS